MTEANLQAKCYQTANKLIPQTRGLLYAIPNGAFLANKTEALKLIATGLLPGVADMTLDIPSPDNKYHGLKIELKLKTKTQSEHQIKYQQNVTAQGYQYTITYTLTEFLNTITQYLQIPSVTHNNPEYDNY